MRIYYKFFGEIAVVSIAVQEYRCVVCRLVHGTFLDFAQLVLASYPASCTHAQKPSHVTVV
jgi:hypothetical protein